MQTPAWRARAGRRGPRGGGAHEEPLLPQATSIANSLYRLTVDTRDGLGCQPVDLRGGAELLDGRQRTVVVDDPSDTWSHDVSPSATRVGRFKATGPAGWCRTEPCARPCGWKAPGRFRHRAEITLTGFAAIDVT